MFNHHLEFVYQWVNPGTTVYIDGDPFRDRRGLKRGMIGSDVYYLQIRLKQLGYYTQKPNGVFDYWTEKALRQCQTDLGLPVTGEISAKEYYRLRLYPTD
jgi:N-acetylmuramoyl-L-alanine amidase